MVMQPAIVVLNDRGLSLAQSVKAVLPEAEVHGFRPRVAACDVGFEDAMSHLAHRFEAGQPIIGICAAGILIRALSSVLSDKGATHNKEAEYPAG